MNKRTTGDWIFDITNFIFLGILGVITLFPFWNVVMTSVVDAGEYFSKTIILWPEAPNLSAYRYILSTNWIGTGFLVTITITILGVLFDMILVVTASYAMIRKTILGYKVINYFFIITMYFSGGLIPYYLLVARYLNLTDNILSMVITSGLQVWSYLVLRNFFQGVPAELTESARIDGASELRILANIMLPLAIPPIATLSLFAAVAHWNEWSKALYFINDPNLLPLQMVLRKIVLDATSAREMRTMMDTAYQNLVGGSNNTLFEEAVKAATVVVTALPIILVYPFLQKYFIKGVLVGSVKG